MLAHLYGTVCSLFTYDTFLFPEVLNANQSHRADLQPFWQFCVLHLQVTALKIGLAGCTSFAFTDRMRNSLFNKKIACLYVQTLTSWTALACLMLLDRSTHGLQTSPCSKRCGSTFPRRAPPAHMRSMIY